MTGQSQNCVTGVAERNLSQSQILKGIQDKSTECPKIFFMVSTDEMMDYKGELRLVFVARLPGALVDTLLSELDRSAYKKNNSTESALIKVQCDIPRAIDNNC